MSKVSNSYDIFVEFTPWTDKDFVINCLHMYENIGGDLAKGYIELLFADSPDTNELVTDEQTGTIILEDKKANGLNFKIPVFITSRRFYKNNILTLEFVCVEDKKFFTDPVSLKHSDITDALNSLYPGTKDIRTESDINNDIEIYQMNETNYEFCTKLAMSFKKDAIFSYGWEGLMIKDLKGKNSLGKDENNFEFLLVGQALVENTTYYSLNYNKYLLYEPKNPWEEIEEPPINPTSMIYYDQYYIMGIDYFKLHENYKHNQVLMNSNLYTSFIVVGTDIPDYKIGDIITYQRAEQDSKYPFTKFLVYSNELYLSQDKTSQVGPHGMKFEWTTKLLGIEDGKWSQL